MFDSTRLAGLVAVAEAGSITRAAARLGYTAPALSQQLAKLEREAGAELLVRTHRGARLTAAGEVLVAHARRALDEMDRARLELSQLRGLSGGRLRIGTFTTAGIHLLPPVLTAFRREHPEVELRVAEYEPPAGVAAVAAGDADLALTHVYEGGPDPAPPPGVTVEPLLVEDLVLVTSPGHALAAAPGPMRWAELAGQPLVSSAPDYPNRQAMEAALRAAGVRPVVVCETPAYVTVCALVSAGLGMGLVPRMMAESSVVPLGVRALAAPGIHRTIALASRGDDTSPGVRTLRALLLGTYRRPATTPGAALTPPGRPRPPTEG
ncbi:LysR family transcriptional regulator [Streptomyces sp. MI02-7b]|uniref:LysR family transcriptional regulator n=1 Tax=Streptomyces sp. MI02-7b TaxID=462941 RepID=UPI0029B1B273|nr:LysR family transcriptional regulator [Streptomyces sp. MI02-7b]MDX3073899.1 LysR family transcriptional regulator [Streptomyces sp. MI02-7b]